MLTDSNVVCCAFVYVSVSVRVLTLNHNLARDKPNRIHILKPKHTRHEVQIFVLVLNWTTGFTNWLRFPVP